MDSFDTNAVDAFLLYNEQEDGIDAIAEALRRAKLSIHYWRTDIAVGDVWIATETRRLQSARTIVVVLGPQGWGPTQLQMAERALAWELTLLPVLWGRTPAEELAKANGVFQSLRYRHIDPAAPSSGLTALVDDITRITEIHPLAKRLMAGDDDARALVLEDINQDAIADPLKLKADLMRLLGDVHPSKEAQAPKAAVPAVRSRRSWIMAALVHLASDDPTVGHLTKDYLQADFEPHPMVRFWLLAATAGRPIGQAALIQAAADPAPVVKLLAEMIRAPRSGAVIKKVRAALRGRSPGIALQCLRAQIIPEVLPDIVPLVQNDRYSFAALNALTQSAPVDVAFKALDVAFPVVELAERIVRAGTQGNRAARRRFAGLLSRLPPGIVEGAFANALRDDHENGPFVEELREFVRGSIRLEQGLLLPGYRSDTNQGVADDLGIQLDVDALTAVMLARDVDPPLAIGLFGDWGTGKSFFIQAMQEATARLAEEARGNLASPFCADVVEVEFNAWHYADSSLWANLVTEIIKRLSQHVSPNLTPEEQTQALSRELDSARDHTDGLERQKADTLKEIGETEGTLSKLRLERQTAEIKLTQLRLGDFADVLSADQGLKTDLQAALTQLGAPAALTQADDLSATVRDVNTAGGRVIALISAFSVRRDGWKLALLVLLVLAAPAAVGWGVGQVASGLAPFAGRITLAITTLAGGIAMVREGLKGVAVNLSKLEAAKARVDQALALRRATPSDAELVLEQTLSELFAREKEQTVQLQLAAERVASLRHEIEALKDSGSLARFLVDRSSSDDYRKHLGLIATVRDDFEALSRRLKAAPRAGQQPVDRIVLYIDDLDRCPAERVVEVLEAVHLLLAFPLFVVVVAVDPGWLDYALKTHHPALAGDGHHATPQDFLEKIFQIPVSLRPMSEQGFGRLMRRLLENPTSSPLGVGETASTDADAMAAGEQNLGRASVFQTPDFAPPAGGAEPQSPMASIATPPGRSGPEPALLRITPQEALFAEGLFAFFSTPRAAKRFTNTYRLLKAQVDPADRLVFEGHGQPWDGGFRLPMVLLALVVSSAPAAKAALANIVALSAGEITPDEFHAALRGMDADAGLATVVAGVFPRTVTGSASGLQVWLPLVRRYSFEGIR